MGPSRRSRLLLNPENRNFHWCHRGYPQISDVFISKIKDFYLKQQEKLDESVKKYAEYAESRTAPNLPPH
ncbi:hypothetical protein B9Z55_000604 [Caenorhabditis nigoni]|uniref:Uncharacterized protein n=1 Tax=Caenorhabditis nigoni TaxID=1611254 RepID=A0A2G5VTW9_9PELO|nr:hypothetical protein B9Z55_000604 [Caenorhabditis nigoni]